MDGAKGILNSIFHKSSASEGKGGGDPRMKRIFPNGSGDVHVANWAASPLVEVAASEAVGCAKILPPQGLQRLSEKTSSRFFDGILFKSSSLGKDLVPVFLTDRMTEFRALSMNYLTKVVVNGCGKKHRLIAIHPTNIFCHYPVSGKQNFLQALRVSTASEAAIPTIEVKGGCKTF